MTVMKMKKGNSMFKKALLILLAVASIQQLQAAKPYFIIEEEQQVSVPEVVASPAISNQPETFVEMEELR
jgi:hypothetical protein